MEFAQQYFWTLSKDMRAEIVEVQHIMAIHINNAHSKLRAMR